MLDSQYALLLSKRSCYLKLSYTFATFATFSVIEDPRNSLDGLSLNDTSINKNSTEPKIDNESSILKT